MDLDEIYIDYYKEIIIGSKEFEYFNKRNVMILPKKVEL